MILPLALLLAAGPETAVDAERAFYRSAQTEGQWTAFRKFSTPGAVIFTPQPAKAHEVLPKTDPTLTVQWWPADSYVACDGSVAVNTGPWVRPKGVGYFTTVWVRQPDGHYKWIYDGGDDLATPRPLPETPRVRTASCGKPGVAVTRIPPAPARSDSGASADGSLVWSWRVEPDGARVFEAKLWTGKRFETVLRDEIAGAK